MADLRISINCLCHFVPDLDGQVMHVLMPATGGHHHHHRHQIVLQNGAFSGGRSMRGWALELGAGQGPADLDFSGEATPAGAEIVDLTRADCRFDRSRLRDAGRVAARLALHAGEITRVRAESTCDINQRSGVLAATEAVWLIRGLDPSAPLSWTAQAGAEVDAPPFATLADLQVVDGTIDLKLHHVTEFPPNPLGGLDARALSDHFAKYLEMYGVAVPGDDQLPRNPRRIDGGSAAIREITRAAVENGDPEAIRTLAEIVDRVAEVARNEGTPAALREALQVRIRGHSCVLSRGSLTEE